MIQKTVATCFFVLAVHSAWASPTDDLWHAVEIDNSRGLASVLKAGLDPNTRDAKGQVPLYVALRGGSLEAAKILVTQPRLDVDAANAVGETPLMMAALRGQTDIMQSLIARGARIHQEGWSAIHYAATGEEPKAVALLLDRGAPVDPRAPDGSTPLMMAARYGKEDNVDLLLARGADRSLRNLAGQSAEDRAQLAGREWLMKRLAPGAGR